MKKAWSTRNHWKTINNIPQSYVIWKIRNQVFITLFLSFIYWLLALEKLNVPHMGWACPWSKNKNFNLRNADIFFHNEHWLVRRQRMPSWYGQSTNKSCYKKAFRTEKKPVCLQIRIKFLNWVMTNKAILISIFHFNLQCDLYVTLSICCKHKKEKQGFYWSTSKNSNSLKFNYNK